MFRYVFSDKPGRRSLIEFLDCSQGRSEGYVLGGVHAHFLPTKWAWPKRGMGVVWARFTITT